MELILIVVVAYFLASSIRQQRIITSLRENKENTYNAITGAYLNKEISDKLFDELTK